MAPILNIVVSCSDRKRLPVPTALRARAVRGLSLDRRFGSWWERLSNARAESVQAEALYVGDHWHICRSLPALAKAKGFRPKLWIASAGYGLVPADSLLHPYSATFAGGQPDAVVTGSEGRGGLRRWWSLLAHKRGPTRGAPRTLKDVVRAAPRCRVLLVCSPSYVNALADDLTAAIDEIADSDHFLIVTSRTLLPPALRSHLIPSEARLKALVGGAMPSLHARVARKILVDTRRAQLHVSEMQTRFETLLRRVPELARYERAAMTDAQLNLFIRASLMREPTLARTPMLRKLRASGYACEQARFGALFGEVARHAA